MRLNLAMRGSGDGVKDSTPETDIGSSSVSLLDISREEILFGQYEGDDTRYCCICVVDMVCSTQITAQIALPVKIGRYYSIFLNAMAALARNFGGKVMKNVGDALIFYFPNTSDSNSKMAFKEVFECFNAIIAARDLINSRLSVEGLPEVSYRISADYGQVEVGRVASSGSEDLFGPTVNICSKINPMAEKNGIIIGSDLYRVIKRFSFEGEFAFRETGAYGIGFKQSYPLYSVKSRTKNVDSNDAKLLLPASKMQSPPDVGQIAPMHKQTIMVVDDEPDILATFKSFLGEGGVYNVEAYSDSHRALQAFARSEPRRFNLIILDIRMPSMNGIQLYKRLKAIDPYTKVIFLTALDAAEELVSALEGVRSVDVMKKPIGKKHFLQRVEATIRGMDSSLSGLSEVQ